MTYLGEWERWQTARKEHTCTVCKRTIDKGERYCAVITLPGVGAYPTGDGGYEPVDWGFSHQKLCDKCFMSAYGYDEEEGVAL